MNRLLAIKFLVIICLFFLFVNSAFAQAEHQLELQYVVQPGDTLSKIALRFGISENDIIVENNISNPNLLFAGAVLTLPGVDWVEGLIDSYELPVGETFRSIQKRFNLDTQVIARLGSLVSPAQLFAGYPLLIASNRGEDFSLGRVAVGSGSTTFGIAVTSDINPWSIAGANRLTDPFESIAGEILLLPGTNDPGPGALPSPLNIEVLGGNFLQGKTTVILVSAGSEQVQLDGDYLDQKLNFFPTGDGSYVALQGIHAMAPTIPSPLTIRGVMSDNSSFEFSQMVGVRDGGYGSETFSDEPYELIRKEENNYLELVTSQVSPQKMWVNVFQFPVNIGSQIKSEFGIRRSFRGSPYNYFHSGVDLGWDAGVEIYAPANGTVVQVGHLEIRGNVTIIDHGWGVFTLYAHQKEIIVQVGDTVEPGQLIGYIGDTGLTAKDRPHLHWEVWVGGVQVEPLDWLYYNYP